MHFRHSVSQMNPSTAAFLKIFLVSTFTLNPNSALALTRDRGISAECYTMSCGFANHAIITNVDPNIIVIQWQDYLNNFSANLNDGNGSNYVEITLPRADCSATPTGIPLLSCYSTTAKISGSNATISPFSLSLEMVRVESVLSTSHELRLTALYGDETTPQTITAKSDFPTCTEEIRFPISN